MFDINSGELLIIALVALMVFGPQRLPELLKKAGSFLREMRAMGAELQRGLERDLAELKAPVDELKDQVTKPVRDLKESLDEQTRDVKRTVDDEKAGFDAAVSGLAWNGPVSDQGPSPDDALADLSRIEAGEDLLEETDD